VNFRRNRHRSAPTIDLVNLIDVIFMLLIFFMMSTTFTHEARLRIDLPEADGEPRAREGDAIKIAIDRRGDYSVENRLLVNTELATLMRALEQAVAGRDVATQQVIITADANATHQSVVNVMESARLAGYNHISFTTQTRN